MMNWKTNKPYKAVLLATMAVLLAVTGLVQPRLNQSRSDLGLTEITPLENAPPMLAFTTVALGGFRGIIANALWIRANDLQDEGRYFEMVQLADWITKLQPRMAQVWTVVAWNMAYNISVKFPDHSDRWRWVRAGIELLRDQGLKYNPDEALIYRELAWFFQHKMGHYLDAAHQYYKQEWAIEMGRLLGIEEIDWEALINPQTAEDRERVRLLVEEYKMDPAFMKQVDEEYGPLEWKLPETHAIYWARLGLDHADDENKDMLRRVIHQSMYVSFRRGRLINLPDGGFMPAPNLDIAENVDRTFAQMREIEDKLITQDVAYKNFLRGAVYELYLHNRVREAVRWWNELREGYPDEIPAGTSIDDFAVAMVTEDVGGMDQNKVSSAIMGLLNNAYFQLSIGEDEVANRSVFLARQVWTRYMTVVGCLDEPPGEDCDRTRIQPIEAYAEQVLRSLIGPEGRLDPTARARLITALGLPADFGSEEDESALERAIRANPLLRQSAPAGGASTNNSPVGDPGQ